MARVPPMKYGRGDSATQATATLVSHNTTASMLRSRSSCSTVGNGKKCTTMDVAKMLPKSLRKPAIHGKEVVTLKSADMVRKLVVPGPEPNIYPIYFDKAEFCRLAKQSRVLTAAERLNQQEEKEAARQQLERESIARKQKLATLDKYRAKSVRLAELEADAERKAGHLLSRARELQQESQDEVKSANRLIISMKCHAIRVAQIAEKQLIEKELAEEEQRLDRMMEQQRMLGLKEEEKRKEEESLKNQQYLQALMHQIQEVETERIHDAERREEESRLMNEAAMQVQLVELAKYKDKLQKQAQTRQYLSQVNKQLRYFQDLEREENRQAELKVQKFMADKAAREAAQEEELRKNRLAKEQEIARLRAAQERMADLKAQEDELRALRTQDEVEREWRRKEKEEAHKKAREEAELRRVRQEQIACRRSMQAVEIAREKQQFESIIRSQLLEAERERLEQLKRQGSMESFRMAILKQINEKERERIQQRKTKFEEGVALRTEEEQRKRDLRQTMKRKTEELRANKVPDIYIQEIERQLKLNEDE